jgi:uncharacterized membrane protein YbhN (UPF0104 family)
MLVTLLVGAVRWRFMLNAYGADPEHVPPIRSLFRLNVAAQYFSVLPTGVAGEAYRAYRVQQCFSEPTTSYVVLFIERIAGLVGLLALAGTAALLSPEARGGPVASAMNVGLFVALIAATTAFVIPQTSARYPALHRSMSSLPVAGSILRKIPAAKSLRPLGPVLILSVLSQLGTVASIAALLAPLSANATLSACARVVPPIILVTYLPLTPGGLGQREAAFAHFFGLVHVEREAAVAASLLYFAVYLCTALLGGLLLAIERTRGTVLRKR